MTGRLGRTVHVPDHDRMPRHVIAKASYRDETFWCSCGVVVTAEPDKFEYDAHQPLVSAWRAHSKPDGRPQGGQRGPRRRQAPAPA